MCMPCQQRVVCEAAAHALLVQQHICLAGRCFDACKAHWRKSVTPCGSSFTSRRVTHYPATLKTHGLGDSSACSMGLIVAGVT
jgi:hypothetical protein